MSTLDWESEPGSDVGDDGDVTPDDLFDDEGGGPAVEIFDEDDE
jgi:hypothetical protein